MDSCQGLSRSLLADNESTELFDLTVSLLWNKATVVSVDVAVSAGAVTVVE